ncbi:MAG: hypothetical protein IJ357_05715 [Oscillospiraceae bacterium]|nr:hypothetical protein [Oscillospiraceae bacterium]
MKEYQESYCILWKGVSAALDELRRLNYGLVTEILMKAQMEAEECFVSWEDNEDM